MTSLTTRGVALALVLALSCTATRLAAQADLSSNTETRLAPFEGDLLAPRLPGKIAGSERWIVHFAERSFDLAAFRTAIAQRRPAAELATLVKDLETQVVADQAEFVTAVTALGARVTEQWWLINAAAIEIDPLQVPALRAVRNVAAVEPDRAFDAVIRASTNALNHNADALQAQGHKGLGATAGIMDTGQDEDMNGTGRPHRAYFVNGDPNNPSGGGIGGSRLLVNRRIGALAADDQNGHGTGVASIVAGANWGTGGADDGHAPMAGIAGYAIANQVSGGSSSSSTMASAWQSMAADRAAFNIVAANLSYGGSPSPTNSAQQALDSAALNADIMICVAAGNAGPNAGSTSGSQSAVNGLAVAALSPNTHVVADFSSRGPMSGDTSRFYPDIAACGVDTVMAARNDEVNDFTASGTSMASPQVCGAATQLRGRFPSLTALQTKAILLATTNDISTQNPNLDRNAYGMGILRNDRAHDLAAAGTFGSAALTSAAPLHVMSMPIVAGRSYAIAIAWHRQTTSSRNWSNLDLEVRDANGATIATSTTPRNLYELVRFEGAYTGTVSVRTNLASISGTSSQTFAFAWFDGPPRGRSVGFGAGCIGSGPIPVNCASINAAGGSLAGITQVAELAYDLTTNTALTIAGFEVFSASMLAGPVTVNAAIYGVTGIEPSTTPLATTTVTIDSSQGFYRGTFASPVNIPVGRFWISVDHTAQTTQLSQLTSGASFGAYSRPSFGNGAWTRSTTVTRASVLALCQLSPAVPSHTGTGTPRPGLPIGLQVAQARPSALALLAIGASDSMFGGGPLPLPLDAFGAPGCALLTSVDITTALATNALGSTGVFVTIPAQASLLGTQFYSQFLIVDVSANALGLVTSNGLRTIIGS